MTIDRSEQEPPTGIRIVLTGVVDRATAGGIEAAVRDGLRASPKVQVDLREVERWEGDALGSVADCARLGNGIEFLVAGRGRERRASA